MELYLIRHGQTTNNAEKVHAGWAPTELTEKGRIQAQEAKLLFDGVVFDRLYVSDLIRTQQTADIIFPGRERILDARIREHNVGILEYQKISDCMEKYGQAYQDARTNDDFSAYQGESAEELTARIADFMKSMEQLASGDNPPRKVAVVTHGGPVFHILCYVLGMKLSKRKISVANCSVSKFIVKDGTWKVGYWNMTQAK